MTAKTKAAPQALPTAPASEDARKTPKSKISPPAKRPTRAASKPPVAAKAVKPSKEEKPPKEEKPKKIKTIRDSFIMPEDDYALLAELKKKGLQAGIHMKKSELLRAGIRSLSGLSDAALMKAMKQVEKIKTGRPAKE